MWEEMTPWRELGRFRQVLLILLAAMLSLTALGVIYESTRPGIDYCGEFFLRTQEGETTQYKGDFVGSPVTITVTRDQVEIYNGNFQHYGPYAIRDDPAAVPETTDWDGVTGKDLRGLEVWRKEELLFRGGAYQSGNIWRLFEEDGTLRWEGDYGEEREPSATAICTLYLGPALSHMGSWLGFGVAALVALFGTVDMLFAEYFFKRNVNRTVQNVEDPEPTLEALFFRGLGELGIVLICAYICILTLTNT